MVGNKLPLQGRLAYLGVYLFRSSVGSSDPSLPSDRSGEYKHVDQTLRPIVDGHSTGHPLTGTTFKRLVWVLSLVYIAPLENVELSARFLQNRRIYESEHCES